MKVWFATAAVVWSIVVPATSEGAGAPALEWSPAAEGSFDFGQVYPGETSSVLFRLTNRGGSATAVLTVAVEGSPAFTLTSDACTGRALGPGKWCAVTATFTPADTARSGTGTLSATGKRVAASATLTLIGPADLHISPGTPIGRNSPNDNIYSYDFGKVTSGVQTFTVTNDGNGAVNNLEVWFPRIPYPVCFPVACPPPPPIYTGPDAADSCSFTALPAGGSCSFEAMFAAPGACKSGTSYPYGVSLVDAPPPPSGVPPNDFLASLNLIGSCP